MRQKYTLPTTPLPCPTMEQRPPSSPRAQLNSLPSLEEEDGEADVQEEGEGPPQDGPSLPQDGPSLPQDGPALPQDGPTLENHVPGGNVEIDKGKPRVFVTMFWKSDYIPLCTLKKKKLFINIFTLRHVLPGVI